MSELPAGWATVNLGELADFEMGQAPPGATCNTNGVGTVFVKAGEFGREYPVVREWTTQPLKFARAGDVLICVVGATSGKLNLGIDCAIGRSVAAIRPSGAIQQKTLYRQLQLQVEQLRADSTGTAQGVISKQMLSDINLVLPPLPEQTRIADQLDKLLARIQSCNDRLVAIPALLKRFRQAVLGAAIKGDLIEGGASSGWRRCTIGDVLEGKPRNGYSPKAVVFETPVRSLTLSATTSGRFLAQHSKFIDEKIPDSSHLWLESGDILIQRANTLEYVGVSAIFDGPAKQFIYPDLMMKCRPNQQVLRKYLFFTLSAEETRQYFRDQATGTSGNMPKINQQTVMSAPIVLPSLEEQERIVKKVDALFHFADRIEARYTAARTQAQRLTTLLLAKAFRGELVPQDHNDEPASELLPRIVTTGITKASSRKKNQKKKVELMNNKAIVPIIDALRAANSPLTATELLVEAGYPADASTELIEKFFLDIRNELDNCRIERVRRGVDDVFSLVG
jgi:type I restriction enzyme S subunit